MNRKPKHRATEQYDSLIKEHRAKAAYLAGRPETRSAGQHRRQPLTGADILAMVHKDHWTSPCAL